MLAPREVVLRDFGKEDKISPNSSIFRVTAGYLRLGMLNCIGSIDGIHIPITVPKLLGSQFLNRKPFHFCEKDQEKADEASGALSEGACLKQKDDENENILVIKECRDEAVGDEDRKEVEILEEAFWVSDNGDEGESCVRDEWQLEAVKRRYRRTLRLRQ
ncbi:hypothetical protein JRQ81_018820 [Phrynocephalus forsythii]|uniref:DDE Tnp4 domain-containing protein n=1 Tax=Phrynocephalus forsythii TaxID=171643 RepID=A0A9Q1AZQ2_9SAUR|nr:hypothetical protein JRQ81_018820 [Phrynocephalus forsythii]